MVPKIFVCGATGLQGGAVTRSLLSQGATVHALTRNPSSPKAQSLASTPNVTLFNGSYDDQNSLSSALEGASAAFLNFMPEFADLNANLRQAKDIISLAKQAGVTHLVYSSSFGPNHLDEIEHLEKESMVYTILKSKADIEDAVRQSGLQWTILRPGNFMANYVDPLARMQVAGLVETGSWITAVKPDTVLPLIDTTTIGAVSAAALLDSAKFGRVDLAYADEPVTAEDVVKKLAAVTGRDLKLVAMPEDEVMAQKSVNPFIGGQLCMRSMSGMIDWEGWRKYGFPVATFDDYLKRESQALRATYAQAQ